MHKLFAFREIELFDFVPNGWFPFLVNLLNFTSLSDTYCISQLPIQLKF